MITTKGFSCSVSLRLLEIFKQEIVLFFPPTCAKKLVFIISFYFMVGSCNGFYFQWTAIK